MSGGVGGIPGSGQLGQAVPSRQSVIVRPREDIGSIAARLNLSTADLLRGNPHIQEGGPLRPGTELFLPQQATLSQPATASGGLPSVQFERAQANIFGTLAGAAGRVDAIPRPGPGGVSATPIQLPNVPDGSLPPGPIPAGLELGGHIMNVAQAGLQSAGLAAIGGTVSNASGLSGIAATPIQLPNVPDGSLPPGPIPAFRTAVAGVHGSLIADQPDPDPGPDPEIGAQAAILGHMDIDPSEPDPPPDPPPVGQRAETWDIGLAPIVNSRQSKVR